MVQVDVFWSYAIGAGTAAAAGRQLRHRARERAAAELPDTFADNPWFTKTVLFLAVIFGPSGAYLLWQFTSWETMHAGDRTMPAWLVTGFVITNVTQGILGFLVTRALLLRGRGYLAFLQMVLGYFCMFFILAHGWDGTGYQRFFSSRPEALATWTTGDVGHWFTSDVFLTLVGMGVVLVPVLVGMTVRWTRAGYELAGDFTPSRPAARLLGAPALAGITLLTVFGAGLGTAVAATVLMITAGPVVGAALFVPAVWFLGLRRGGLIERLYRWWAMEDADLAQRAAGRAPVTGAVGSVPAVPVSG